MQSIGVIGLWHLGCVIAASWLELGYHIVAVDFDKQTIDRLTQGKAPIYEPGLEKTFQRGLEANTILFSSDPKTLASCNIIFLAYDTPVDDRDQSDIKILDEALQAIKPHIGSSTIVIISSQVPAGTCKQWQSKYPFSIAYVPENLKLGEALANYLNPGHTILGAEHPYIIEKVTELFAAIPTKLFVMDLTSAEMVKHAINAFLATSITFANQLFDVCSFVGAHFLPVAAAMKQDPRIGLNAYLKPGIGFSGGTLGRDLRNLSKLNTAKGGGTFPFFQDIWQYNKHRPLMIVYKIGRLLKEFQNQTITFLGITYKPGTSTLRRSLPLAMAQDLCRKGSCVKIYDPEAEWPQDPKLEGLFKYNDPYEAAAKADLLFVATEWPAFRQLDMHRLSQKVRSLKIFDPHFFLADRYKEMQNIGFQVFNHLP